VHNVLLASHPVLLAPILRDAPMLHRNMTVPGAGRDGQYRRAVSGRQRMAEAKIAR